MHHVRHVVDDWIMNVSHYLNDRETIRTMSEVKGLAIARNGVFCVKNVC